jgi:hypothetical protein
MSDYATFDVGHVGRTEIEESVQPFEFFALD